MSKPAPSSSIGAMIPLTLTLPSVGLSTPAITLSKVDLPAPLKPSTPTLSPFSTVKEISLSAQNSVKCSLRVTSFIKYSLRLSTFSLLRLNIMLIFSTTIAGLPISLSFRQI